MTTDLDDDLSIEDLLARHMAQGLESVDKVLIAKVESYDATAQLVDATPVIRAHVPRADGDYDREALPTIRAVPVLFPRSGDYFVHLPIASGDYVLLVCLDRDHSRWLRSGGDQADAVDLRAHHLSHAIAIPGIFPRTSRLADTPTDAMVVGNANATLRIKSNGDVVIAAANIYLGADSATDFVALASEVDSRLSTIVSTYNTHTHPVAGATATAPTPMSPPTSVASSKVRAQ